MKDFIHWNDWRYSDCNMPVAKILKICIGEYVIYKHEKRLIKWQVVIEIDAYNPDQQRRYWSFNTEKEAREFYNYCLNQIAEWQDKRGE